MLKLKKAAVVSFASLTLFATLGHAEQSTSQTNAQNQRSTQELSRHDYERSENKMDITGGLSVGSFEYNEIIDDPRNLRSQEKGTVVTFEAAFFNQNKGSNVRWGGLLELAAPTLTYDGTTQQGKPITPFPGQHSFFRLEPRAEFNLASNDSQTTHLIGYSGLGYRFWKRGDTAVVNGVSSTREDYSWFYLPVGARVESDLGKVKLALDAAARMPFSGKMTVKFSEMDSRIADATVNLGSKLGYKIAAPVSVELNPTTTLVMSPWYEYSAIRESEVVEVRGVNGESTGLGIKEPSSTTVQYGGSVGAKFVL